MRTKEQFWQRILQLNDDFSVFDARKAPATEAQIEEYEQKTGFSLSSDFKDFLLNFGTLILEVEETVWKRPKEFEICEAWHFGYGMFVFGLSQDAEMPEWLTYTATNEDSENRYGQLFFERSGNLYRAYTNNGKIYVEYDEYDPQSVEIFNGNLYDFLIQEINRLEEDYHEYIYTQK